MKPATFAVAVVLGLVAVGHLLRLIFHVNVVIGGWVVPMWISVVGGLAAATLSFLLFLDARRNPA